MMVNPNPMLLFLSVVLRKRSLQLGGIPGKWLFYWSVKVKKAFGGVKGTFLQAKVSHWTATPSAGWVNYGKCKQVWLWEQTAKHLPQAQSRPKNPRKADRASGFRQSLSESVHLLTNLTFLCKKGWTRQRQSLTSSRHMWIHSSCSERVQVGGLGRGWACPKPWRRRTRKPEWTILSNKK